MTETVATTSLGRVRGRVGDDGVRVFRGIPYAASTAGSRRFLPPARGVPWSGIRDAFEYGQTCSQAPMPIGSGPDAIALAKLMHGPRPKNVPEEGENCLVLNVWTPLLATGVGRPVMVWIHGGGFTSGSGSSLSFVGDSLVRRGDVVVVTVNHRLGALGFLDLSAFAGTEYSQSGNVGMLDLVAALEWVQENIAEFGGDPENVMIFGESGGAAKVSSLLGMPRAQGLFHRAAMQSGLGLRVRTSDAAREVTDRLLAELNLSNKPPVEQLLSIDVREILQAQRKIMANIPLLTGGGFGPVVDGELLPSHPFDPVSSPIASEIPLLIGSNQDEMTLFFVAVPDDQNMDEVRLRSILQPLLRSELERIQDAYHADRPTATRLELAIAITTDYMRMSSITLAERKVSGGSAPVWTYNFAYKTPEMDGRLGATHMLDVPFVFDNVHLVPFAGQRPERFALAAAMSGAWLTFARSADPNREGLAAWAPYADRRATMRFDTECRLEFDPDAALRSRWSGVF